MDSDVNVINLPQNGNSTDRRKNELLIVARRSRIKWILGDNRKKLKQSGKNEQTAASTSKILSTDTLQRTFNFLADIIQDGETVDIDSLFPEIDVDECDDTAYHEINASDELIGTASLPNEIPFDTYTYTTFLENLCLRDSISIVKSFQQFVSKFESRVRMRRTSVENNCFINEKSNIEEITKGAQSIWIFLEYISCEMEESSVFGWKGPDNQLKEQTKSYCEKFIFSKLYSSTFHSDYDDCFLNEKLRERIRSLSFLLPEHLDIKVFGNDGSCGRQSSNKDNFVKEAVQLLSALEYATCPDDKVNCIRSASISIASGLMKMNKDIGDAIPPGADDVLPLLIYCVKESNPPYLYSELKYLQAYTDPTQLQSEPGYLITQMLSAVAFLESVDASALTISPDEFNRSFKKCKERDVNTIPAAISIKPLSEEVILQVMELLRRKLIIAVFRVHYNHID